MQKHPEITVFLHTASPFHYNTDVIKKDLLLPAIHGTENALKAIKSNGPQISKVVLTSSLAANFDVQHYNYPYSKFSERTSNPLTYDQAKMMLLWDMLDLKLCRKENLVVHKRGNPNFSLSVVNSVYLFGPQALDEQARGQLNTFSEVINYLLKLSKDDKIPETVRYYIDVRDIAKLHVVAFKNDKLAN